MSLRRARDASLSLPPPGLLISHLSPAIYLCPLSARNVISALVNIYRVVVSLAMNIYIFLFFILSEADERSFLRVKTYFELRETRIFPI